MAYYLNAFLLHPPSCRRKARKTTGCGTDAPGRGNKYNCKIRLSRIMHRPDSLCEDLLISSSNQKDRTCKAAAHRHQARQNRYGNQTNSNWEPEPLPVHP